MADPTREEVERVGENGWRPINTMPLDTPGYLGRWFTNNDGYMWWSQSGVERRFRLSDGSEHWSYGDQPPFYGEPATHWHPALLPPAKPCLGRAVAAALRRGEG